MKYFIIFSVSVLLLVSSPVFTFASEEIQKEGAVTLQRYNFSDDESKKTTITLGKEVEYVIDMYIGEFFEDTIISANAKIINKTDKAMCVTYFITFYDAANNVIGAYAMSSIIKPNMDTNYGSALINGKEEDFKRVTKYKVYTCSYETIPPKEIQ